MGGVLGSEWQALWANGERAAPGGAGGGQSRRAGVSRWRGEVSALKGDGVRATPPPPAVPSSVIGSRPFPPAPRRGSALGGGLLIGWAPAAAANQRLGGKTPVPCPRGRPLCGWGLWGAWRGHLVARLVGAMGLPSGRAPREAASPELPTTRSERKNKATNSHAGLERDVVLKMLTIKKPLFPCCVIRSASRLCPQ